MSLGDFKKFAVDIANSRLQEIEKYFKEKYEEGVDVLSYFGSIDAKYEQVFRTALDGLIEEHEESKKYILCIILETGGGSIETTEKFVKMIRKYYEQVFFIVPNYAMSAGTIWCMSGDKIFMDYSSSLGPIDAQIYSPTIGNYVPSQGYINEYEERIKKQLTNAEFVLISQKLDYAFLNYCKNLKELTKNLLEKWLVEYKFKDWTVTESRKAPVTKEMKKNRAIEIANKLGDSKNWCIHSRPIMIKDLEEMKLHIDDYSENEKLRTIIRNYIDYMQGYLSTVNGLNSFIHTRKFI